MIRFYILPQEEDAQGGKGPKYLKWRFDPDPPGLDVPYICMAYGLINACLIVANVTVAEHTELSAYADVAAVPEDIDQNIGAAAVPVVQNVLEAMYIPSDWVDTSYTYRQILRGIAGLFQFAQRYKGLHGEELITAQSQLDLQWNQISVAKRQRIQATADSFQYDYSAVTNQWTTRRTLMHLAQQWGSKPFQFYHNRGGIDITL